MCILGISHQLRAQQAGQAAPPASPQTPVASPQAPPATPPNSTKTTKDSGETQNQPDPAPKVPQNDRILWALPNYLTVENASTLPPLTTRQKFKLATEETFDPVEFGFVGLAAGVNQATNANPSFGQGFKGYGKRFALEFCDNTIEDYMAEAVFPSLLRQDPRYYQLGKGSFFHRAGYAALRAVVTRSDTGETQFNFSEVLGSGVSAAISNAYHPGPRTLGSSANVWATQIGWDVVGFEMKEFWPDVHRFLTHRNH
jgi:hypothetical protein